MGSPAIFTSSTALKHKLDFTSEAVSFCKSQSPRSDQSSDDLLQFFSPLGTRKVNISDSKIQGRLDMWKCGCHKQTQLSKQAADAKWLVWNEQLLNLLDNEAAAVLMLLGLDQAIRRSGQTAVRRKPVARRYIYGIFLAGKCELAFLPFADRTMRHDI